MSFSQSTYSVNEDGGPAQPVLVLSNQSSIDIIVQLRDINITAMGNANAIANDCSIDMII